MCANSSKCESCISEIQNGNALSWCYYNLFCFKNHYDSLCQASQQEDITNMEQPVKFSDRNPIDYTWERLSHVDNRIFNP